MNYPTTTRRTANRLPEALLQAALAIAGGLALFVILLSIVLTGFSLSYSGKIYPGISVAGVDLSGLRPDEAAARITSLFSYPGSGKIVFQEGDRLWQASPSGLGLYLDAQSSAMSAYSLGRQGSSVARLGTRFNAWRSGIDLPPLLVYDQRMALNFVNGIAAQVNTPTVEASLRVNGTDVIVEPGKVGRSVDVEATLAQIEPQLRTLTDGLIPVMMNETMPVILDASAQAEIARQILSQPLELGVANPEEGDPGPWTFDQNSLSGMLVIERVETGEGMQYQVGLDAASLRTFLENTAPSFERYAQNARFIFNDDTRQLDLIEPGVIGRSLDVDATIQAINEKVTGGGHRVDLVFNTTQPAVGSDATAAELGITELVEAQTTYFYGSSAARIQNIKTASSRFHGVFVPPQTTFSMASILGDVSLDNGYAEALIIFGNRTIKGVGGGVCQVSTTLFRTVFFGGFPVAERHSHAYRVGYYEQNAYGGANLDMVGLDATVYVPVVDFKFTNDTDYWLLMETYVVGNSLTWKFYSTSDGRSVEMENTGLQNVEEAPEPLYQENPELNKGEIKQVDWEADGADVTVYRTVHRDGGVYLQDHFTTYYMPWRAVYEYGPGTKLPKDANKDDD